VSARPRDEIVGAMVLARIVDDEKLSMEILTAARESLLLV
jgi:hypothetical protein